MHPFMPVKVGLHSRRRRGLVRRWSDTHTGRDMPRWWTARSRSLIEHVGHHSHRIRRRHHRGAPRCHVRCVCWLEANRTHAIVIAISDTTTWYCVRTTIPTVCGMLSTYSCSSPQGSRQRSVHVQCRWAVRWDRMDRRALIAWVIE